MWTERLLGLEPLPAPPHVFSLTRDAVGYARLMGTPEGWETHEVRSVALSEDTYQSGPLGAVASPQALAEKIGELVRSLSGPVDEASLILPDGWIRVTFLDVEELPRSSEAREDVIRWKLKRFLPVRPEEVRLDTVEVEPLPGGSDRRLLVTFGLERLLTTVEAAFDEHGVRIGRIMNESVATMTAIADRIRDDELAAVVLVRPQGYTLVLTRAGEPVLHRFKVPDEGHAAPATDSVERDLRLTRAFLDDQLSGLKLERVLLLANASVLPQWAEWLEVGLGVPTEVVTAADLELRGEPALPWPDACPIVGAVSLEVS